MAPILAAAPRRPARSTADRAGRRRASCPSGERAREGDPTPAPRELVARVRAVLRRFSPRDADTPAHPVSVGTVRLDPATFEVTLSGQAVRLTGTELRLLEVLMRAVGQVQSRESLTERVLGRRLTPYDRSIDTHVSNLRRKLGLGENGLPEIRSIRGAGYVLIATGEVRAEQRV